MATGIAELKKLLNEIAPSGEYLVVDFTQKLAQFHFGRSVTPRHALQLVRSKLEYGKHIRETGRPNISSAPSASADARRQIKAIQNAPTDEPTPQNLPVSEPVEADDNADPNNIMAKEEKKPAKKKTSKKKKK